MSQLVELSCAWLVSGVVALSTINMMCMDRRFSTTSQNQIYATNIAQAALDDARSVPYSVLLANTGTFALPLVAGSTPGTSQLSQRPIFRDDSTMFYSQSTTHNGFDNSRASATETITQLEPGLLQVTVNVQWVEQQGKRQLTMCTTVSQNGIHG